MPTEVEDILEADKVARRWARDIVRKEVVI